MHHERLIAEIAQKVESEYTPQRSTPITPKMAAQLEARLRRNWNLDAKEFAAVQEIAARMRFY